VTGFFPASHPCVERKTSRSTRSPNFFEDSGTDPLQGGGGSGDQGGEACT
jgi:hypothetical protein